jgi:mono/diheme cytochrome c family protein
MRERMARIIAALSGLLIVLAVLAFGAVQNKPGAQSDAPPDPAAVAAGATLYEAQGCNLCHTIAGEGGGDYPLDGVGKRLSEEQIRRFIAPSPDMQSRFPGPMFEMKQAYHSLTPDEMSALAAFVRSLP